MSKLSKRAFESSSALTAAASALPPAKKHAFQPWQNVLKQYVDSPESFDSSIVKSFDHEMVVIYDAFPKSSKHFLALPRNTTAANVQSLSTAHLSLLESFQTVFKTLQEEFPESNLRAGFHAIPSMAHLHLHIISDDMISPALKNKKHWNSFTTKFFVSLDEVVEKVAAGGSIEMNPSLYEALLKGPLVCHKCFKTIKNMPELKRHLEAHLTQK
ncbi:hypothetical protein HDU78_004456 [Chytriomyces hyalinus]|nr:hypothetical protein HDU78_004451 [Chytriomyces hyalinus]KAJ3236730.1 hypothetical protein HDU78_004456 [Chytriomyces hyalinus]